VSSRGIALRGALCAAAALAAFALPARAGLFDDDEARRRIEALRQELSQQGKDPLRPPPARATRRRKPRRR